MPRSLRAGRLLVSGISVWMRIFPVRSTWISQRPFNSKKRNRYVERFFSFFFFLSFFPPRALWKFYARGPQRGLVDNWVSNHLAVREYRPFVSRLTGNWTDPCPRFFLNPSRGLLATFSAQHPEHRRRREWRPTAPSPGRLGPGMQIYANRAQ